MSKSLREILITIKDHCPSECDSNCEHCKKWLDRAENEIQSRINSRRLSEGEIYNIIVRTRNNATAYTAHAIFTAQKLKDK